MEPPTAGKVVLVTSLGDIELELWSKEAPLSCRNFVQHCLDGYFDGVIFHRVIKGLLIQSGDPTGTGTGGDAAYGEPVKSEFHSRLKFTHRGLLATANNLSQFAITLAPAPWLERKHTIFGKCTGTTIYNAVQIAELEVRVERGGRREKRGGRREEGACWCLRMSSEFPCRSSLTRTDRGSRR